MDAMTHKLATALADACNTIDTFVVGGSAPWREILADYYKVNGEPAYKDGQRIVQIVVYGRLWFGSNSGYTTATAVTYAHLENGEVTKLENMVEGCASGGYYLQMAGDRLEKEGFLPDRIHYPHGGREGLRLYCERRGIDFSCESENVQRKRDLHNASR